MAGVKTEKAWKEKEQGVEGKDEWAKKELHVSESEWDSEKG